MNDSSRQHNIDFTLQALKNSGVDITCGACCEVAFTGVTTNEHTCPTKRVKAEIVPVHRYARIRVTPDLLLDMIHLPSDTRVIDVRMVQEQTWKFVELLVSHSALKEVPYNEVIPLTTPYFRTEYDERNPSKTVVLESRGQQQDRV